MWMGERITDKGLGNGVSILIMVGILARFPGAVLQEFNTRATAGNLIAPVIEVAFLIVVVMCVILLVQGTRRIPSSMLKEM
jgi:preprotein translocase subunit SecY